MPKQHRCWVEQSCLFSSSRFNRGAENLQQIRSNRGPRLLPTILFVDWITVLQRQDWLVGKRLELYKKRQNQSKKEEEKAKKPRAKKRIHRGKERKGILHAHRIIPAIAFISADIPAQKKKTPKTITESRHLHFIPGAAERIKHSGTKAKRSRRKRS